MDNIVNFHDFFDPKERAQKRLILDYYSKFKFVDRMRFSCDLKKAVLSDRRSSGSLYQSTISQLNKVLTIQSIDNNLDNLIEV